MIQSIFIGIALLTSFFGLLRTSPPAWTYNNGVEDLIFGATNFPTSLDALTNPSGTDSVATVSHSGQHSNANDAIEALEAKLGITASTPISGTVLVGDGTGTSRFSTYATTTSLRSTNITATGSSTLQNFTFVNATGTSATTTNFSVSNNLNAITASSTTATTTNFYGADLVTCQSTNALTWTGGKFGCVAISTSGPTVFSTTTANNMSTTTFTIAAGSLPDTDIWRITFNVASTTGSSANTADTVMVFNNDNSTLYSQAYELNGAALNTDLLGVSRFTLFSEDGLAPQQYYNITINNSANMIKHVDWIGNRTSSTTNSFLGSTKATGFWETPGLITRIDIGTDTPNAMFATGTVITILGY